MKTLFIILLCFFDVLNPLKSLNLGTRCYFTMRCEKALKFVGIKDIYLEFNRDFVTQKDEIHFFFLVEDKFKGCTKYRIYFKNTNDTLRKVKTIEGVDILTGEGICENLSQKKQLRLVLTNECIDESREYRIIYKEIKNEKIRAHFW